MMEAQKVKCRKCGEEKYGCIDFNFYKGKIRPVCKVCDNKARASYEESRNMKSLAVPIRFGSHLTTNQDKAKYQRRMENLET